MNLISPLSADSPKVVLTDPMSALSSEARLGAGRLHGKEQVACKASEAVQTERPEHIHIAKYIALGLTQADAGRMCGYSGLQVSKLMRCPWFQERVATFLTAGSADIMTLFKGASLGAYVTLVEVCNSEKMPPSVRVSAAKEILDRHLGKSTQFVEMKATGTSADPVAEVAALEREVANLSSPRVGEANANEGAQA